jgi:aspartate/methionine/tyrosine aminotransferase
MDARRAVVASYGSLAGQLDPAHVFLTASSSEAYGWLFKLLASPGDSVLVPQPSYPLFEVLAQLEGIEARPYRLDYHGVWSIDRESLGAALTPSTRAIVVVTPNNPTGSMLRASDREWLAGRAAERALALVSDEVFADYPLSPRADAVSLAGEARVLTFVLGGLSKSVGLPQVKLGWIAASGPQPLLDEALERLDVIADAYLSVSTPVQLAAARLLETGASTRERIQLRIRRNLGVLRDALKTRPELSLLEPEGGWSAVLRVPAVASEEAIVLDLIRHAEVVVHPGYFFDFEDEAYLVVSLLPEPAVFDRGVERMLERVSAVGSRA